MRVGIKAPSKNSRSAFNLKRFALCPLACPIVKSDQLAAYEGLTPSQFSSSDQVRMGQITRSGKADLRGMLVEAAWILVRKGHYFQKK